MSTTFRMQQVLNSTVALHTEGGADVPVGTRVVVMNHPTPETVKVKVRDKNQPTLDKARIVASVDSFAVTFRGRPKN